MESGKICRGFVANLQNFLVTEFFFGLTGGEIG
jgi:hypothetical protein